MMIIPIWKLLVIRIADPKLYVIDWKIEYRTRKENKNLLADWRLDIGPVAIMPGKWISNRNRGVEVGK